MNDRISPTTTRDTLAAKGAPGEPTNLSYQYGSIGIQAVAAAARYADIRKTPAEAHAAHRIDQRFVESAV